MKNTAIRGRFSPQNKDKYRGNVKKITYRSLWERKFMLYCDKSNQIRTWSSEELHIPYIGPDDKWHNYYPDFIVNTEDGRTIMVEIKPNYQKKWKVNKCKWSKAEEFCKDHNWEFRVLTEKELF